MIDPKMASTIYFKEQQVLLNNMQFSRLIDFAIEVGEKTARSSDEQAFVAELKRKRESFWPGIDIDVAQDFPTEGSRKFWARCFHDVARWVFLRKLGNQDLDFWQATTIHQARATGNLFTDGAREFDQSFFPESEDSRLFDAFHNPPTG